MIIVPDKLKEAEGTDITVSRPMESDDPPPAYFSTQSEHPDPPLPPIPAASTQSPSLPSNVKPTNHLSLSRANSAIKGSYILDPCVKIPPPMLPPLASDETEETRRNLYLYCANGSVDVDVWLINGSGEEFKGRVRMQGKSLNGSVEMRLHTPSAAHPPLHITATSTNGSVTVHLPRSFRGLLTSRMRNGSIKSSPTLAASTTQFNESSGTRRAFIGDFSDWVHEDAWTGDELHVETWNGNIKLQYDTESDITGAGRVSGSTRSFLSRFLGR